MSEPKGQRFSQIYFSSPELLPDSARMRRRLGHAIGSTPRLDDFKNELASELGIVVPYDCRYSGNWPSFLQNIELRDVLDTVTVRYRTVKMDYYDENGRDAAKRRKQFLDEVRRIFREERVRYRVDDAGGVHFTVDTEFERARIAAISEIGAPRYNGVREAFEAAYATLDEAPPDGKAAIRSTFFAAECLFRLMYPACNQLNAGDMSKNLKPRIDALYADKKPAIYVAQKQISAFKEWIDAAHFYRHEPGTEEPAQPPLELAIEMVSQGATFIRWLARLDRAQNPF